MMSSLRAFCSIILFCFLLNHGYAAEKTECPEVFLGACSLDAADICVYLRNGRYYQTVSNPCVVCKNKSVIETSLGPCPP